MATRANKYASLNFNDIYEKKIGNSGNKNHSSSPSSSSQSPLINSTKTALSNSRIHGNMLVLSRPSPKPIPQPTPPPPQPAVSQPQPPPPTTHHQQNDVISLRPLGKTGSGPSISQIPLTSPKPDKEYSPSPLPSPKQNRFVPPHLRPGFAGREGEKPVPEIQKQQGIRSRELGVGGHHHPGQFRSPNRFAEDGRPKSGGGYERMRRAGESDLVEMKRPSSSGTRPSSSG